MITEESSSSIMFFLAAFYSNSSRASPVWNGFSDCSLNVTLSLIEFEFLAFEFLKVPSLRVFLKPDEAVVPAL